MYAKPNKQMILPASKIFFFFLQFLNLQLAARNFFPFFLLLILLLSLQLKIYFTLRRLCLISTGSFHMWRRSLSLLYSCHNTIVNIIGIVSQFAFSVTIEIMEVYAICRHVSGEFCKIYLRFLHTLFVL